MAEFEIEELARDSYEVRQNGRPIFFDAGDLDEAEAEVYRAGGHHYLFIGQDGYEEERDL